jgi:hypothetical protein
VFQTVKWRGRYEFSDMFAGRAPKDNTVKSVVCAWDDGEEEDHAGSVRRSTPLLTPCSASRIGTDIYTALE